MPFRSYRWLSRRTTCGRAVSSTSTATPPVTTAFASFTEVAAGSYPLDVRTAAAVPLAGTQQVGTLVAGKIYTLYVRGTTGNTANQVGVSVVTHH